MASFSSTSILALGLFALGLLALPVGAEDAFRVFSDTQNRTFEGKLMAFNATNEVVTIERADGRQGRVPLSVFSEDDREYIRKWGRMDGFMSGIKINVALAEEPVEEDAESPENGKLMTDYYFTVRLNNGATEAYGPIVIEYCIFYRQGNRKPDESILYSEGTCYGKETLDSFVPAESKAFQTKRVRLYALVSQQNMFGMIQRVGADVRGIWLRVKTKLPGEGEVVREFRTADDPIWKWTDYSIGAGLNKGDTAYRFFLK